MIISVVIPAYNCESTIIHSIESVLGQCDVDGVSFEIIVVNDGSLDNTLAVLDSYVHEKSLPNVRVYSKPNGGVSSARNYGIAKSSGEWVAFLDSDDVWLPNKIKSQLDIVKNIPDLDFIGCARNHEMLRLYGREVVSLYKVSVRDLLFKMFPQTSTALVRKSLLNRVGYYNEEMTHSEDGELWIRLCRGGSFYYMPESLVVTGGGKANYGERGLSADLKKMQAGAMRILDICYENGTIGNMILYHFYRLYYIVKYWRRLFLLRMR